MGLLDDIGDFFGLGGGGGAATSFEVKSTLAGGLTSTIQGGDRPVEIDAGLDDVNVDVDSNLTSTIRGGDTPLSLEVGGGARPTRSVAELRITEPIETVSTVTANTDSRFDVEPMVVDLCVDVGLSKLPRAAIRQPYKSHFGVQVLGTELLGFDWVGEADTVIDDLPDRGPTVIGGPPTGPQKGHGGGPGRTGRRRAPVADDGPGLRIRLE